MIQSPIDISFLPVPDENCHDPKVGKQGWGSLPVENRDLIEKFRIWFMKTQARNILEIGTFAGHSATLFLETFDVDLLLSLDPNVFSRKAALAILEKYGDKFNFRNIKSKHWDRKGIDPDLVYIDGSHTWPNPDLDIELAFDMKPKWIMMDNIELPDVRKAIRRKNLMQEKYDPDYFYYTTRHNGRISPGILGLFDVTDGR